MSRLGFYFVACSRQCTRIEEASDRSGHCAARFRSMAAISFGTDVLSSKASCSKTAQNCGSNAMEVLCPIIVSERFSSPPSVFEVAVM